MTCVGTMTVLVSVLIIVLVSFLSTTFQTDLPSWQSHVNFYRTHGKSADLVATGQGIYSWQVKEPFGNYQFVAIDAWQVWDQLT